ncbi:MAG: biotin/lipoyl-containing protein [Longibaculum muris]|uniref:Biotin carboxyl carrier protein of acetyl-CoA carboxylase n=1 Tax=Longibaculum muris TaxID=1796628 RepID=A0A4R3Z7R0_9FIRM|nr:biotin/lipoyl-containing protein [Longibaculum muris]KXU51815.1 acetyl-CoA carboxylase, biotin carboxyl carrier protein [Candidatus Stoquefichus sp. KLE1796]MBS5369743.1 acetyl-CoA carboxylase biotin carboxyl carrier protein subunit [Coprobacillus cateniformis]MCR1886489.1 acetyl-CoA carboxylase biotin carboxyl carrier protein subunit [Longibaculum muris]MED9811061.1 biotin/lipoyl-containing protein [Longibaculum muris]TCW02714.1 acetyl-CoA carboxylase biotin carboxyl carrier protein [Longi
MDTEKIKSIMKMFEESQISKMDLTDGDLHITLEKEMEPVEVVKTIKSAPIQEVEEVKQEQGTAITSPLVGTYYQASGTNQEPFVKVGQHIQEGDTVCIIEAMKVMNEIKATVSGTVLSINVSDGETVEYDQVLMMIG